MSIRILVVDDNPDILANVRDFLSMIRQRHSLRDA